MLGRSSNTGLDELIQKELPRVPVSLFFEEREKENEGKTAVRV